MLSYIYWLILILALAGAFGPPTWPFYYRFLPMAILFACIGLKIFRVPLTLILACFLLTGCPTLTPEQVSAYGQASHSIIGSALQDYKAVKQVREIGR